MEQFNIHEKLKEVKEYFKKKILNGDFTVINDGEYFIIIEVDGYRFSIWVANGFECVKTYESAYNEVGLEFLHKEKRVFWSKYVKDKKDKDDEEKKEKELRELERLKKKYELKD